MMRLRSHGHWSGPTPAARSAAAGTIAGAYIAGGMIPLAPYMLLQNRTRARDLGGGDAAGPARLRLRQGPIHRHATVPERPANGPDRRDRRGRGLPDRARLSPEKKAGVLHTPEAMNQELRHSTADAIYPFSALVGQEGMKRALILAAIHPGLGGVLIRGSKGAAKSTAVRALAALLPDIEVCPGDPFLRAPGEDIAGWPLSAEARFERRPVALVNLPVGATDDRVTGSLNLERALTTGQGGSREAGSSSRTAHRGDPLHRRGSNLARRPPWGRPVARRGRDGGQSTSSREGLTFRHPSRFVLVGTMNPEEGDPASTTSRPLRTCRRGRTDGSVRSLDARAEVVRRRLAFEADPAGFLARWREEADPDAEGKRIKRRAQRIVPSVIVPEIVLVGPLRPLRAREGGRRPSARRLDDLQGGVGPRRLRGRTTVTLRPTSMRSPKLAALAHPAGRFARNAAAPLRHQPENGDDRPPPWPQREAVPPREEFYASRDRRNDPTATNDHSSLSEDDYQPQLVGAAEPFATPRWAPQTPRSRRANAAGRRGRLAAVDRFGVFVRTTVPDGRSRDPALARNASRRPPLGKRARAR